MPTAGPSTVSNYVLDWSSWLDPGETIATSGWAIPAGLTSAPGHPATSTGTTATVWLTGGTIGQAYVVPNTITTTLGRTEVRSFSLTIVDPTLLSQEPYCTLTEARNAGAVGSDLIVQAACEQASERVDRFTDDRFSPRIATVAADVQPDGRAFLPYRVTSPDGITAVTDAETGVAYAAAAWLVTTSATPGEVDAIGIGASFVGTNILVNGLEPWNRSYRAQGRIRVTGQFGWAITPHDVRAATAHLAAIISASMRPDDDDDPSTPTPETAATTDPEGNVIPVVPPFANAADLVDYDATVATRTTGSRRADAMLVPYRNTPALRGV